MNIQKINAIEEVLAHQEQQINDLSDMLIAQGREIEGLQREILKLHGKIETIDENDPQPTNQKPPHY